MPKRGKKRQSQAGKNVKKLKPIKENSISSLFYSYIIYQNREIHNICLLEY